ncbi:hypothetical protein OEZ74_26310, partial [Leclercia adecarboxylata]|uniref:hypothetical protein n=1 Tax=Leclercia adecarboxylata TaxID=83655 RepID=UPI00234C2F6E
MLRLLLFAVVLCGLECVVAAAEPVIGQHDPGVPELAVLERFAGRWEAQLANSDELIHGTRVWVLSGRFLQHDYTLSSGSLSGTLYRG